MSQTEKGRERAALLEHRRKPPNQTGPLLKRQVLYLGEINDAQRAQWCSALEVLDESNGSFKQMSLFPEDRAPPPEISNPVRVRLNQMTLHRPRQWGGCWLAKELWDQLDMDSFWALSLPESRKGTGWLKVLTTLVAYRLLDPFCNGSNRSTAKEIVCGLWIEESRPKPRSKRCAP